MLYLPVNALWKVFAITLKLILTYCEEEWNGFFVQSLAAFNKEAIIEYACSTMSGLHAHCLKKQSAMAHIAVK